jgi:4-hydroxybenzoate polyprenyltransferase
LLRYFTGVVLAASEFIHGHPLRTLAGAPIWGLAVFAVYLFNGVMDIHEDRINGSGRPIARGVLPQRLARRVAAGAAASALIGSITLGMPSMAAIVAYLIVGYLYSGPPYYLERKPIGSAVAAASLGPLMCYGGLAAYTGDGWTLPGAGWLVMAVWMWLWMGLVGAPAKDLGDVTGDAAAGRRTLPVIYGESRVRLVVPISAASLATAFFVVSARLSWWLAAPGAVMLTGPGTVTLLSMTQLSHGDRSHLRRPYRAFMATQFAVYLAVIASIGAAMRLRGS